MDTRNLLDIARDRFADALSEALSQCGLRLPSTQQVIWREAANAFEELAELRSKEDYERRRSMTTSRISLVDSDDMDLTVTLINLGRAIRDACELDLSRLHNLFMRLLNQKSAVVDQMPVGPEAICIAMRGICNSGEISDLRLKLPALAERHLIKAMQEFYPQLARELMEQGMGPAPIASAMPPPRSGPLLQTMMAQDVFASGPPGAYASAQVLNAPHPAAPLNNPFESLSQQRSPTTPVLALDVSQAINERVLTWLDERQHAGRGDVAAKLAELLPLLPATSHATLQTLDHSFGVLTADERLCSPVRADLERLRLPVAKAVLLTGKFPKDPVHPPKRLLEVVLRLGYSLPPRTSDAHPVCQAIDSAVIRLQREFDRDTACFFKAAESLEVLENRVLLAQTDGCGELLYLAQAEVQRERSRHHAARAVRAMCADGLPRPVQVFLEQLWVRVLAVIHQHGGDKSGAWLKALRTANKLVTSVQPCSDSAMRDALRTRLPNLMNELRAGLDAISTPDALRERAFHSLAGIHSAALGGRKATDESAEDIMTPGPPRLDPLHAHPGAFVLRLAPTAEPEARGSWISELEVGDWLDIELPEYGWHRLRLAWLAGNPLMMVGTSLDGDFRLIFPARWLLRAETAHVLPMRDLFDRAVEQATKLSEAQAGAPLTFRS